MVTAFSTGLVAGVLSDTLRFRILATTDLHSCILPHDYITDRPMPDHSLAHTARLVAAARAATPNCILLDNGDFLQGSPMGDYVAQAKRRRALHPMIAAFNALGYDAGTLGNHEFNFGLPFLQQALNGARHPVVCANLVVRLGDSPTEDQTLVPPFALLDRRLQDEAGCWHSLRIGIIGFTPPQTLIWDRQHLEGRLFARDILVAARAWVPVMRQQGAEVIVALSHSGIGPQAETPGMENATTALAGVPGIDALIAGHSHLVFPSAEHPAGPGVDPLLGSLSGKPAVMPGHSGSHLGLIDLVLRRDEGAWSVAAHSARSVPVGAPHALTAADRSGSAALRHAVRAAHRATLAWARLRIGRSETPLSTYFAHVSSGSALKLIAEAKRAHVRHALQGTAWQDLPVLSAVSPFKAGGRGGPQNFTHIPAGDLALRHAADLYIFPNMVAAVCVSGLDLALWLERAASQFLQVPDGSLDAALIDPEFPSFNFDQMDGVTYAYDLSQPARFSLSGHDLGGPGRVRSLCHLGLPVTSEARFVVATNSYRANGSGGFPGADPDHRVVIQQRLMRDVLRDHIAGAGSVQPAHDPIWHFTSRPGTTVVFDSHPDSAQHMTLAPHLHLEPLGLTDQGFQRFRLHL